MTDKLSCTPGPWSFRKFAQSDEDIADMARLGLKPTLLLQNDGSAAVMAGDKRVALVDCQTKFKRGEGWKTECAERDANAHLIAAAHDMYAALGRLLNDSMFKDHPEASQMAIDALAKARGEKS